MAKEKRLIDANALLENIQYRLPVNDMVAQLINDIVDITRTQIVNAPTVDAVPVVRCRDCKHRAEYFDSGKYVCELWHCRVCGSWDYVKDNDFCSYGERKEN